MKYLFLIGAVVLAINTISCGNKSKKKDTETQKENVELIHWDALYNTSQVLQTHKHLYDSLNFKVVVIHKENKLTKDSAVVDIHKMDWRIWDKEFDKINLYDKKFDKRYTMTQFALADQGSLTTNINAGDNDLIVRKMMINTQLADNDLTMLFVEYIDNGIEKKLMYVPYKKFQLIELSKGNSKITQLDLTLDKK